MKKSRKENINIRKKRDKIMKKKIIKLLKLNIS